LRFRPICSLLIGGVDLIVNNVYGSPMGGTVGEGGRARASVASTFRSCVKLYGSIAGKKRFFGSRRREVIPHVDLYECPFCGHNSKRSRGLKNHNKNCKVYESIS